MFAASVTEFMFLASLAGMLVAVLFRSAPVRDAIAAAWVAVKERHERPPAPGTRPLADAFISALLLTRTGRISKLKTFGLAYVAAATHVLAMWLQFYPFASVTRWYVALGFVLASLFFTPVHWFAEYVVATTLVWVYRRFRAASTVRLVTILLLAWGLGVVASSVVSVLAIGSLGSIVDSGSSWTLLTAGMMLFGAPVVFPALLLGFGPSSPLLDSQALLLMALSFLTYSSLPLAVLFAEGVAANQRVLGLLASTLDRLSAVRANWLLGLCWFWLQLAGTLLSYLSSP